jgi:hypothetical protein
VSIASASAAPNYRPWVPLSFASGTHVGAAGDLPGLRGLRKRGIAPLPVAVHLNCFHLIIAGRQAWSADHGRVTRGRYRLSQRREQNANDGGAIGLCTDRGL